MASLLDGFVDGGARLKIVGVYYGSSGHLYKSL